MNTGQGKALSTARFFTFRKLTREEGGGRKGSETRGKSGPTLYCYRVNRERAYDFFWHLRNNDIRFFMN